MIELACAHVIAYTQVQSPYDAYIYTFFLNKSAMSDSIPSGNSAASSQSSQSSQYSQNLESFPQLQLSGSNRSIIISQYLGNIILLVNSIRNNLATIPANDSSSTAVDSVPIFGTTVVDLLRDLHALASSANTVSYGLLAHVDKNDSDIPY